MSSAAWGPRTLVGTYGTFSFYTSVLFAFSGQSLSGGNVYEAWEEDGVVESKLYGPDNPFLAESEKVTTDFKVYIDPVSPIAKLEVGEEERVLEVGEWSDWVPVEFELIPTPEPEWHLSLLPAFGAARVRALRVADQFRSDGAALPISNPDDYASELAAATGTFYTQGHARGRAGAARERPHSRGIHGSGTDRWSGNP